MRFRLSPEWKEGGMEERGAGMEVWRKREWKCGGGGYRKEIDGEIKKLPFLRRQESLRRSRIRRQATIAMFRFAENSRCRENEIPAFAGMEGRGNGRKGEWKKGENEKVME